MKKKGFAIFVFMLILATFATAQTRGVAQNAIPGDNVLRFYRLAIPVTKSAFDRNFNGDYNSVLESWSECEEYVNNVFVPVGFCFDVIEDSRLVQAERNLIDDNFYNAPSFGTELLNGAIEGSSLPFRRSGTPAVQHYKQKNNAAALQTVLALPLNVNGLQL